MAVVRAVLLGALGVADMALPPLATLFAGDPVNTTVGTFWNDDVVHYQLETSVADSVALCFVRGLLVCLCLCCDGHMRSVARVVSILSIVYLLVKASVCENWHYAYTYIIYISELMFGMAQGVMLSQAINVLCDRAAAARKGAAAAAASKKAMTGGDVESGVGGTSNTVRLLDPLADGDNAGGKPSSSSSSGAGVGGSRSSKRPSSQKKTAHACRLIRLAGPEKWHLLAGTLCLAAASVGLMLVPAQFGQLIKVISNNTGDVDTHLVELRTSVLCVCICGRVTSSGTGGLLLFLPPVRSMVRCAAIMPRTYNPPCARTIERREMTAVTFSAGR
jgi:hypothetical protein